MRPAGRLDRVRQHVWMAHWQMECCGTPFRVGAEVSWRLRPPGPDEIGWLDAALHDGVAATVDAVEDHHGDPDTPPTTGAVVSIATVHCRFEPGPVAGSGLLTPVTEARRWTADRDGDRRFAGFLIGLRATDEQSSAVEARTASTVRWSRTAR